MQTPTTNRSLTQSAHAHRETTVCVVDPRAADYETWHGEAAGAGLMLHFCSTAEEALRFGRTHAVALWVVNTELSGLSGHELCGMLKNLSAATLVYLVADQYSPAAERAAWSARATLFGCKPAHTAWLSEFLQFQSRPTSTRRIESHGNRSLVRCG